MNRQLLLYLAGMAVFILLLISPVSAGEKYYTDGPDITVSVYGTNELSPGSDAVLTLLVQNSGLIDMKLVQNKFMTPDYLPNTAKSGVVTLMPGDSPVQVKSDSQVFGDLPSGYMKTVSFDVYIPDNAGSGTYEMYALTKFEYMENSLQSGTDAISYIFKKTTAEIPVTVVIKPFVVFEITNVSSCGLNAGGEGYIDMDIKNTGTDTARSLAVFIDPSGNSPLTPVENSVFAGDLAPMDTISPRFKVAVSKNADPSQSYPLVVYGIYKDYEGFSKKTEPVTTGINFDDKITFKTSGTLPYAYPGGDNLIYVTYKNTGGATAYQAQGRISVVDPFSGSDTNVYLGDMKPGEEKKAVYKIKVDSGATIKEYSLDSEIRYNDAENNNYISDTVKVVIDVRENQSTLILPAIFVLFVIAAAGYILYRKKISGK